MTTRRYYVVQTLRDHERRLERLDALLRAWGDQRQQWQTRPGEDRKTGHQSRCDRAPWLGEGE